MKSSIYELKLLNTCCVVLNVTYSNQTLLHESCHFNPFNFTWNVDEDLK